MDLFQGLKKYFGYDDFRRGQRELVEGVVSGKDVLGIMPTGGGKSLCYQLPALLLDGITVVISPLISLMKDQVDSLNEMGIKASYINSSLTRGELNQRINEIKNNQYKIIYVAPERLTSEGKDFLQKLNISLVAIDEAHCISQWGHDFRPSYVQIPKFIESLEERPVVAAFTATATERVVEEIKTLINLIEPISINTGFDRPNLFYQVLKVPDKLAYTSKYLQENNGDSGIIYCSTRKTVESLTKKLKEKGIDAADYHGGMNSDIRKQHQEDFIFGRTQIIVATNAFGMGIDKPDVRFVIHYNMPQNMESYYQEAGRAGRDGEDSQCILLYSPDDIVKQKILVENGTRSPKRQKILYQNLQYLIDYCHTNECLRNEILSYFGERIVDKSCSSCGNCLSESEMIDITVEAQKILSCIYRTGQRYGTAVVAQVLRGSKNKRIIDFGLDRVSTYGIMKEYTEKSIKEIALTLAAKDYIYITTDKFPVLKLTQKCKPLLKGQEKIFHKKELVYQKPASKSKAEKQQDQKVIQDYDQELMEILREVRLKISQQKDLAPFMIFHDKTLKEMAAAYPQDKDEFIELSGVGLKKYDSYGQQFIDAINEYCKEKNIDAKRLKEKNIKVETVTTTPQSEDRYEQTYQLYKEGVSLDEISQKRGYTTATILKHLKKCQENGNSVNWDDFLDDLTKEKQILTAIEKTGTEKLRPIKQELPEEITYDDIHVVIYKHKL
ncbi:DNA helicase RecQ [Proteinivorax hydrogeniformans]|uniref:DNA helicase RecQ n=1 Tax=Proteinivorax hydrogeniformans TaxID=1826727 RepID=A0AAU8HVI1_9FIRM